MASITKRPDGQWRARYRDQAGKEHARHFARKADGQAWLDQVTSALVQGTHVDPRTARTTVGEWCATWMQMYGTRRASTVETAAGHVKIITAEFGAMPLASVRPSHVMLWTAGLKAQGRSASYVRALHSRLSQIMTAAVNDGIIPRSPCSRQTSPGQGKQRPYLATTEQVWALHDAMPEHLRSAVLLGAFAGLRVSEACGLRVNDVDYLRGIVAPTLQYPAEQLKTDTSRTPVPIPRAMAEAISASIARHGGAYVVTDGHGRQMAPKEVMRQIRKARARVPGLPAEFRFHDLRHYFASLLIASGADIKTVQARLRHANATTTLDVYGHLWPDRDESTRQAVEAVFRSDGRKAG